MAPLWSVALRSLAHTLAGALLLTCGCSSAADAPRYGQPAGWDDQVRIPAALDTNPDPRVLEVTIVARVASVEIVPDKTTPAWTYDGHIPGPLLRARVGDRLIVHFKNQLPDETTIHWHGLRIPLAMDGVPVHSQPPVKPGEEFTYDFVLPDAGLFWYHPHVRSNEQVNDGLYGALVVEDPAEPKDFGDELVMVLSDTQLEDDGSLAPHGRGGDLATLFGREGDPVMLNGRNNPTLKVRAGVRQRWRLVNAAQSRYFQLMAEGQRFVRIGGDGGLLPRALEGDRIVLAPGERADVIVDPTGAPGSTIPLRWVPYDRGFGSTYLRPDETVATLVYDQAPAAAPPALPAPNRAIAPLALAGAETFDLRLTRNDVDGKFYLGVNGRAFAETIQARVGDVQVWTVTNELAWAHPLHLHGFFFQVLETNGKPPEVLEWKDTADVPQKGSMKLAVRYDDRPGMWMFHCHILDHAEAGMMGMLDLSDGTGTHDPSHDR